VNHPASERRGSRRDGIYVDRIEVAGDASKYNQVRLAYRFCELSSLTDTQFIKIH